MWGALNIPCSAHLSPPRLRIGWSLLWSHRKYHTSDWWKQAQQSSDYNQQDSKGNDPHTQRSENAPPLSNINLFSHHTNISQSCFLLPILSFRSCNPTTTILTGSLLLHHIAVHSTVDQFILAEMELISLWWLVLWKRVVGKLCFTNTLAKSDNIQSENIFLDSQLLNLRIFLLLLFWAEGIMHCWFLQGVSNTLSRQHTLIFPNQTY